MEQTIGIGSGILALLYVALILFAGGSALDCYIKRQLVKANFYLSVSAFGFMALLVLMSLLDSCSNV